MHIFKSIIAAVVLLLIQQSITAQINPDATYDPNIHTVRFHSYGDQEAMAIYKLNSTDRVELHFDDIETRVKSYYYTYQLCDYIWQPDYGAGLARFIGQPGNELAIRAVIRSQIFREAAVARTPEPVIDVRVSPDGAIGTVHVQIRYVDAPSGRTEILSFAVGP